MGQNQCCESNSTPTHIINPTLALKFLDLQQDPKQCADGEPLYLTSRSTKRHHLGENDQGQFSETKPNLTVEVKDMIKKLPPIQLQCYRRLKNERGIAEINTFFKFYRTNITYQGQWYNNKPHGYGKNYYPNGGYYQGTFIKGLPHGFGRFINANGDYYEGQVKYGRGNGEGIYHSGGIVFRGLFKDNVLNGEGEERGSDYYFKGEFQCGSKKQGLMKFSENVYEGGFENDNFEGKGTLTTAQGKYIGNFLNGLQHGYGQFHWKNGSKYRGNYRRGLKDGDGEYFNADNNSICRGIWTKGRLEGDGQYVQPRGTLNKVIWQDNKISAIK